MAHFGIDVKVGDPIRVTEDMKERLSTFHCKNGFIEDFLKEESFTDPKSVSFIRIDEKEKRIVCFYTLNSSSIVLDKSSEYKKKFSFIPAIELKMFAVDNAYKRLPYNGEDDSIMLSDILLCDVIREIIDFTENTCGADKIVLYSVPEKEYFYHRNDFIRFKKGFIRDAEINIADAIPMYLSITPDEFEDEPAYDE